MPDGESVVATKRKRRAVTGSERRLVQSIHDATRAVLEADDYAKAYFARIQLRQALAALYDTPAAATAASSEEET